MKLIDKNGRLFGKISVVDLLVAAVVIVLALALNFKRGQTHTGTSVAQQKITYQIQVPGIRTYVSDAIRVGDKLFEPERDTGGSLGEITDIQVSSPGTRLSELNDGSYENVPVEDSVDLLLTVRGDGILKDGHYLLNRVYELGVNSSRTYGTRYAQFVGTVAAIG